MVVASRPDLVRAVNAAFSNAFSNSLAKEEVELKPTRTDALSGPALANWILGGKNVGQEASALAAGVRRLVDSKRTIYDKDAKAIRPVRYGDIAILSRSNDKVKELAFALSKQSVPVATAQPGLLSTPEQRWPSPVFAASTTQGYDIDCRDCVAGRWLRTRALGCRSFDVSQEGADADLWQEQSIDGHPAHPVLEIIARLRATLRCLAPREAMETVIAACAFPKEWLAGAPIPIMPEFGWPT